MGGYHCCARKPSWPLKIRGECLVEGHWGDFLMIYRGDRRCTTIVCALLRGGSAERPRSLEVLVVVYILHNPFAFFFYGV